MKISLGKVTVAKMIGIDSSFLISATGSLLLYGAILLHIRHVRKHIANPVNTGIRLSVTCLGITLLQWSVILLCGLFQLPLYILAFFLYLTFNGTFWPIKKSSALRFRFWVNIHAICLFCFYLVALSILSLITGDTLADIYRQPHSFLALFIFAYVLLYVASSFLIRIGTFEQIMKLNQDTPRFRQIATFQWYGIFYLFFDCFTIQFDLPYPVLSVFLAGSCILLLLQIKVFITHTFSIMEEAHHEMEYYRLEEERAAHIQRQLELQELAYRDTLTGAYTRRFAMELLYSMKQDNRETTVCYVDINYLKQVNDTFGHYEGDRYLMQVAALLNSRLYKSDILARIGGDEFLIICIGLKKETFSSLLEQINQELQTPAEKGYIPSFSYGIVQTDWSDISDYLDLIERSDKLMYSYKKNFKERNNR